MEILHTLGTVVRVKEKAGAFTIIGYYPKDENGTVFTYLGVNAFWGLSLDEHALPFQQEDIEEVLFLGYSDETGEKFRIRAGQVLIERNDTEG